MHTLCIHIDETQDAAAVDALKAELLRLPYVTHVEMSPREPHDVLVEFEPHHEVPMAVLGKLSSRGLHSDVTSA